MKKMIFCTCGIILLCIIVNAVATKNTKIQQLDLNAENKTLNNSLTYIIKDFNGNIAVFEQGTKEPVRVTEVSTKNLPQMDQEMLIDGIEVNNQTELDALLEDLCS